MSSLLSTGIQFNTLQGLSGVGFDWILKSGGTRSPKFPTSLTMNAFFPNLFSNHGEYVRGLALVKAWLALLVGES
jgi:hypothetical protein